MKALAQLKAMLEADNTRRASLYPEQSAQLNALSRLLDSARATRTAHDIGQLIAGALVCERIISDASCRCANAFFREDKSVWHQNATMKTEADRLRLQLLTLGLEISGVTPP